MSYFTFFHNIFYAICILKSFNSHISVVICSFFEFGTVSKWCIREWVKGLLNPLPDNKFWTLPKLKEFADDNFKFDENGRKLSKWVENTVGKGEIARYEQFLLFPQCFQKACFPEASKGVIVWEWVNILPYRSVIQTALGKHSGKRRKCW